MGYEFSIVRLKKNAAQHLEFPADLVAIAANPIAGPFDPPAQTRLLQSIARFPRARRTFKDCFEIETPGGGRLEVWFTADGHLFVDSQAGLELLLQLFVELSNVVEDIALEDTQVGFLHGPDSFAAWLHRSEQAAAA